MRKIIFLLLLLIPALVLAAEPVREWKSKSGKTIIEASLDTAKDSDPETVFLLKDGKKYKIPFKNLSKEDREYVTHVRESSRSLEEDFGLEEVEETRGIAVVPAGNQYALLIGVNRYARPIRSLKYCVNDMKLLAESFEKIGVPKENIFLVTDDSPEVERRPTGANIRQQIQNVTQLMGPKDQLTIAFSGHGALVDEKSYLCPSDTNLNDQNSIVSRDWAFDQLEKCKAKQKIFIIDACRDTVSFGGTKALGDAKTLEDPIGADTHGFILIASCDKTQKSWEHEDLKHGVFTYYLAEGLTGAAKDEDGYVSILNLFQYTSSKTKKYVYREFNKVQVPTFRQGDEMTDFCIAKLTSELPISTPVLHSHQATSRPAGERKVLTVDGIKYAFRWCPPGEFMMGSSKNEWDKAGIDWKDYDEFQHRVKLTRGFWLLETEVTQAMWQSVMGESVKSKAREDMKRLTSAMKEVTDSQIKIPFYNPWGLIGSVAPVDLYGSGNTYPMYYVSWDNCQEFCRRLSLKLGQTVKLPTEAQWEYACRAGATDDYDDSLDSMAWYGENLDKGSTHPVAQKKPNSWGLCDMHGNVWEWCSDAYDESYYEKSPTTDPENTSDSPSRVNRGGGFTSGAGSCRSASRSHGGSNYLGSSTGLRILLVPLEDE